MRRLIVRAFSISLDGMSADYGTEYFEWCMSGIDPRVPEVASQHHLPADWPAGAGQGPRSDNGPGWMMPRVPSQCGGRDHE